MRTRVVMALAALGASCVEVVGLDERPCPCVGAYTCCVPLGLCMPEERVAAGACPATRDAAATSDHAPADAASVDAPAGDSAEAGPDTAPEAAPGDAPTDAPPPLLPDPPCVNGGGGLLATYYDGVLATPHPPRVEPGAVLFFGAEPPVDDLAGDAWSATLSGKLQPTTSEPTTFALQAEGGARLWVGGELVIDWWRGPFPWPLAATVDLQAGRAYDLLIEYAKGSGDGALSLRWERPSSGVGGIPQCQLVPAPGGPSACPTAATDCRPPRAVGCRGHGGGLHARHYMDFDLHGLAVRDRTEPTLSAFVSGNDPDLPKSIRWWGQLEAPADGDYTFYCLTSGKTDLSLDGMPVLQAHTDPRDPWRREELVRRHLTQGTHDIDVTFNYIDRFDTGYLTPVLVQLRWKPPGGPKEVIPSCFLTPGQDP